jgi:transcriptional regulator GlxA family with amidase domain
MADTNAAPKTVYFLAYDDCDQLDVTGPLEILSTLVRWLGMKDLDLRIVSIPGTTKDPGGMVRATNGLQFKSEPWDGSTLPDALIVAGGSFEDQNDRSTPAGIGLLKNEPNFTDKIAKQHAAGKLVTSVCTGAFGIVGARVATGRTITTHPDELDNLRTFAASLEEDVTVIAPDPTAAEPNARVVEDGNIITCGGVTSGIDEALYLVQKFWPSKLDDVRGFADYQYTFKSLKV